MSKLLLCPLIALALGSALGCGENDNPESENPWTFDAAVVARPDASGDGSAPIPAEGGASGSTNDAARPATSDASAGASTDAGASAVIPETLESGLQLAASVLRRLDVTDGAVGQLVQQERERGRDAGEGP